MHWYPLCNKHDNILKEVNFWINRGAVPVGGYNGNLVLSTLSTESIKKIGLCKEFLYGEEGFETLYSGQFMLTQLIIAN